MISNTLDSRCGVLLEKFRFCYVELLVGRHFDSEIVSRLSKDTEMMRSYVSQIRVQSISFPCDNLNTSFHNSSVLSGIPQSQLAIPIPPKPIVVAMARFIPLLSNHAFPASTLRLEAPSSLFVLGSATGTYVD